ncbi:fimbrial protein [Variovorax robiniae]|uniref:Fimbrial protein n=1 Tax=Variovorax robiniae TaxID=1836199 RepID=A0ABU8XAA7_9BURK
MRKTLLISVLGTTLALVAGTASAANGTVNFNGEVVASTCAVANADGTGAINVTLPKITASQLNGGEGKRAGQTLFTIDLADCVPASGQVGVRFVGNAAQLDQVRGLFKNTGSASNVEVGVWDQLDTQLRPAENTGGFTAIDTGTGAASIPLNAYYVSTGSAVGAGTVTSSGSFELEYK